jgi:hypothetical protein
MWSRRRPRPASRAETNAANTQLTLTATQKRVSDGTLVSGPGQVWVIDLVDDGGVSRSLDLWALNVANQGPVSRNFKAKVLAGLEDLDISTRWRPPSS